MARRLYQALFLTIISGVIKTSLTGFMVMVGYGLPMAYIVKVIGSDLEGEPFTPYIDWSSSLVGFTLDIMFWFCLLLLLYKIASIFQIRLPKVLQ